jgi:hypothetical protein
MQSKWHFQADLSCQRRLLLQVIGGVFLHQTRKQQDTQHLCTSRFSKLDSRCRASPSTASGNGKIMKPDKHCEGSFGIDPVFNKNTELYDASISEHLADYYNVSTSSCELMQNRLPKAFFARPAVPFPAGFPVLFGV